VQNPKSFRARLDQRLFPIVESLKNLIKEDKLDEESISRIKSYLDPDSEEYLKDKEEWIEKDDTATYEYIGTKPITSFPEAIKFCKVDLNKWEPYEQTFNSWDVVMKLKSFDPETRKSKQWPEKRTNYQFKIKFRLKQSTFIEAFSEMVKEIKGYQAPEFNIIKQVKTNNLSILNLFDAHLDKLALLAETNESSSLQGNIARYETGFDILLSSCLVHRPEEFIFPIGNDLFHTNDFTNTTKRGTPQDLVCKPEESYPAIVTTIRRSIDKARQFGRVRVVMIKGNHDEDKVFHLGVLLQEIYRDSTDVTINNSRLQRKYVRYGNNLFGFAHGDKEANKVANLPLYMAEEMKQDWAETIYREWYLGDKHHKMEYKFMRGEDFLGVMVRFLRSVGANDKWHYDSGYIGIPKTAEAFTWNYDKGMVSNYLINN
jgi:hypothetical protein